MLDFDCFIRDTALREINLNKSNFTWSNLQERLACSRLDRFLFSSEWEELFPKVRQEALVRLTSYHCIIILDSNPFRWGPTPFRFENMWLQHVDLKRKLADRWKGCRASAWEGYKFTRKLEEVKQNFKMWNKEVFGNLRFKKMAV